MVKQLRVFLALLGFGLVFASPAAAQSLSGVGFGDSLMAGFELGLDEGFPQKLEAALRQRGHDVTIAGAGVPGDTTSGGLERLDWSIPDGTDFVILELGGNDALRGVAPEIVRANLEKMIVALKARNITVVLAGMLAPPNMGSTYGEAFNRIYPDLAAKHGLPLYPFFLDGVITAPGLMLGDGIHPTAAGIDVMVERFVPFIEPVLLSLSAGSN